MSLIYKTHILRIIFINNLTSSSFKSIDTTNKYIYLKNNKFTYFNVP